MQQRICYWIFCLWVYHVSEWIAGASHLSSFTTTQPHASYSAFTRGFISKWNYYFHANTSISELLSPLDSAVRTCFLPKLSPMLLVMLSVSCFPILYVLVVLVYVIPCQPLRNGIIFQDTFEELSWSGCSPELCVVSSGRLLSGWSLSPSKDC